VLRLVRVPVLDRHRERPTVCGSGSVSAERGSTRQGLAVLLRRSRELVFAGAREAAAADEPAAALYRCPKAGRAASG
jgi:hypothetical protein